MAGAAGAHRDAARMMLEGAAERNQEEEDESIEHLDPVAYAFLPLEVRAAGRMQKPPPHPPSPWNPKCGPLIYFNDVLAPFEHGLDDPQEWMKTHRPAWERTYSAYEHPCSCPAAPTHPALLGESFSAADPLAPADNRDGPRLMAGFHPSRSSLRPLASNPTKTFTADSLECRGGLAPPVEGLGRARARTTWAPSSHNAAALPRELASPLTRLARARSQAALRTRWSVARPRRTRKGTRSWSSRTAPSSRRSPAPAAAPLPRGSRAIRGARRRRAPPHFRGGWASAAPRGADPRGAMPPAGARQLRDASALPGVVRRCACERQREPRGGIAPGPTAGAGRRCAVSRASLPAPRRSIPLSPTRARSDPLP